MTFSELKARAELLCRLEGWTDVVPPPDWGAIVNEALAGFSWRGEYLQHTRSFATVPGTASYSRTDADGALLPTLDDVWYEETPLERTDILSVREGYRGWAFQPSARPTHYYTHGLSLCLFPPPDGVGPLTIHGTRTEPTLVGDNDTPQAPLPWHEFIALLAASRQGRAYATTDAAVAKVARWEEQAHKAAADLRAYVQSSRLPLVRSVAHRGGTRLRLR